MLGHKPFKYNTTRNAIAVFGYVFGGIHIIRSGDTIKVPLEYSPKEKYYKRLVSDPNELQVESIILPRMGFDLTDIEYYVERERNRHTKHSVPGHTRFSGVPYRLTFELYVYTRKLGALYNIMEQILPHFRPNFPVHVKSGDPKFDITDTYNITLESGMELDIEYEDDLETRRIVMGSMSFTMDVRYYGPVEETNEIRKVSVNLINSAVNAGEQLMITGDKNEDGEIFNVQQVLKDINLN